MMCGRRANWTSHGSRRRRRSLQAAGTHPGAARLGLWLGHTGSERALLIGPVLLILIVELVNSAIEATVDRIGFERHALAGLAKDIGSAAVLMSFVLLAAVWLLVLLGR
ncbi:MAG: diacylglycerol kinase [Gammaproteobacteria bacterium]|nr:MAG: diacylglycerol kinase [Gammaproteobacteria bacterium]